MNRHTKQLKSMEDALNLLRTYAIDGASEPEGFERGYSRKLDKTHGDFSGFIQTTMQTAQKIAYIDLQKKIEHKMDGVSCGAAGALQVKAKIGNDDERVPAYFLPWDNRGAAVQMTIPSSSSNDVHEHPQIFFTAALSGCSILFKGTPDNPTVIHGGSGQTPIPYDANQFWKDFVEYLDQHPDPAIKHAKADKTVQSQATKSQYVTGMTAMAQGLQVKTTQRALDFKAKLGKHYGDTVEIIDVIPWGAVFGLRKGRDWTFYLQENANIQYYPRRKIQQVVEYTRGAPVSYDKWFRMAGPPRLVSRPITLQAVFPGGAEKAELTSSLRSLLRCDPLNDAPNAFALG